MNIKQGNIKNRLKPEKKKVYLRESSRTRNRFAWEPSTQPNTARMPHIINYSNLTTELWNERSKRETKREREERRGFLGSSLFCGCSLFIGEPARPVNIMDTDPFTYWSAYPYYMVENIRIFHNGMLSLCFGY